MEDQLMGVHVFLCFIDALLHVTMKNHILLLDVRGRGKVK